MKDTVWIVTDKMIKALESCVKTGTPKERRFAFRKLIEISCACPHADLASRAHKILAGYNA